MSAASARPDGEEGHERGGARDDDSTAGETPIQRCVRAELQRYFELLDGEPPNDLYRLVMQQVERSLLETVLRQCGGNRSRAAVWLGISRGTLRGKLADTDRR